MNELLFHDAPIFRHAAASLFLPFFSMATANEKVEARLSRKRHSSVIQGAEAGM
jgi:hypothetical protein